MIVKGSLLSIIVIASTTHALAQSPPINPDERFDVEHYHIQIRPDLKTTAVAGTEAIVLKSLSEGASRLSFSANALRISQATIDGKPVTVSTNASATDFVLPRPMKKGQRSILRFRFEGVPTRGITAVSSGIYTSYFACDWMICRQDTPGDKAMLSLDLILPEGLSSVGVGRAKPVFKLGDGATLHRWRSTRGYSSYLFGFAAGSFTRHSVRVKQGELTYFDATSKEVDLASSFKQTPEILAFLAQKAGVELPDRRYSQVLVPGNEAQEAANFSLIGASHLEAERAASDEAWVIAHEMAHQWWGNLVTCATWRDFWLNEGITTFMVAAWKEQKFGHAAYEAELEVARVRLERARKSGFDKPLAWGGLYPSLGTRRAVQYSKGALFLAHLRIEIGDDAFWAGLRRFTQRHAGQTVTSDDLQNAMQKASKRDLSSQFTEWVYGN